MKTPTSNRVRIALIAVLVVAVAYLAVWRPRVGQVADLNDQRDMLSQELAGLAPIDSSPAPAAGSTDAIALAVPPADGLADLLRQFQSIAADTGVVQRAVAAQPPMALTGASGASIPVTISVAGARAGALDYVRRLGLLERLFVVDAVTLEPSADETDAAAVTDDPAAEHVLINIAGRVFTTATPATEATNG